MTFKIEEILRIREYYRGNYKVLASAIIKDKMEPPDDSYYYKGYLHKIDDILDSIVTMELEEILLKIGVFNSGQEIEI